MLFKAISKRKFVLLGGDIFIILLSTFLGFYLRLGREEFFNYLNVYTWVSPINLLILLIVLYITDLNNPQQNFKTLRGITKFTVSVLMGKIFVVFILYALTYYHYGRGIFLIEILILIPLLWFWRIFFNLFFKAAIKPKRILLLGKDWVSETLYEVLRENPEYRVLGLINGETQVTGNPFPTSLPVLDLEGVEEKIREGALDAIVIDLMEEKSQTFWQKLLRFKICGVDIIGALDLYQDLTGKIPICHVDDRWLVYGPGYWLLKSHFIQRAKRLFDFGISLLSLPIALALMGLIALAIKLDSPGPVFYRQRRIGLDEKEFDLIKFRTMVQSAEKETGAVWAKENDSRITRVGKPLRLTRLDELPQLFNVLKEEMSFVGPRPERPEFVKELTGKIPYYSFRHSIKPGITGWAQINYRYGASVKDAAEKLQYDLFYIQNMSILLEIRILLKTISVVIFGKGSR